MMKQTNKQRQSSILSQSYKCSQKYLSWESIKRLDFSETDFVFCFQFKDVNQPLNAALIYHIIDKLQLSHMKRVYTSQNLGINQNYWMIGLFQTRQFFQQRLQDEQIQIRQNFNNILHQYSIKQESINGDLQENLSLYFEAYKIVELFSIPSQKNGVKLLIQYYDQLNYQFSEIFKNGIEQQLMIHHSKSIEKKLLICAEQTSLKQNRRRFLWLVVTELQIVNILSIFQNIAVSQYNLQINKVTSQVVFHTLHSQPQICQISQQIKSIDVQISKGKIYTNSVVCYAKNQDKAIEFYCQITQIKNIYKNCTFVDYSCHTPHKYIIIQSPNQQDYELFQKQCINYKLEIDLKAVRKLQIKSKKSFILLKVYQDIQTFLFKYRTYFKNSKRTLKMLSEYLFVPNFLDFSESIRNQVIGCQNVQIFKSNTYQRDSIIKFDNLQAAINCYKVMIGLKLNYMCFLSKSEFQVLIN